MLVAAARRSSGALAIGRLSKAPCRQYRLLPSQTLSICQARLPGLFAQPTPDFKLASSVQEATQAYETIAADHRGSPVEVRADVLDPHPSTGRFGDDDGLQGASHVVSSIEELDLLSTLMLSPGSSFRSTAPPFIHKEVPRLILRPTGPPASGRTLRLILEASRQPRPHASRPGNHLGPTLRIAAVPISVPIRLSGELSKAVPIDVSELAFAKRIGEVSSLSPDGPQAGQRPEADDVLESVAQKAADDAVVALESSVASSSKSQLAALHGTVKDLFELYWRSDGERFSLDVVLQDDGQVRYHASELQFDDFSLPRQKHLAQMRNDGSLLFGAPGGQQAGPNAIQHELHPLEEMADKAGLVYRKHQGGNVGLFGYGAGMGMGTFDGVVEEGGRPANFFDGGGGASIENSKEAMRILGMDPDVKCILINIFGGITRSDLVSQGVIAAYHEYDIKVPLVARFRGNKAQEAQQALRESNLDVELFDDYREAARRAIEKANGSSVARDPPPAAAAAATSSSRPQQARAFSSWSGRSLRPFASSTRSFSTSQRGPIKAITGYAFAGKPRLPDESQDGAEEGQEQQASQLKEEGTVKPRQGFPSDSIIGRWVDETLRGGEAGEDALMLTRMKGEASGDVCFAVADGVGGWSENGVDPALFRCEPRASSRLGNPLA